VEIDKIAWIPAHQFFAREAHQMTFRTRPLKIKVPKVESFELKDFLSLEGCLAVVKFTVVE
jgi:hypothetical protein